MTATERAPNASRAAVLSERVVTMFLDGELGLPELGALGDELFRLMHHGRRKVVLDFYDVGHLDYRGVKQLVARAGLFRQAGGDIKLSGLSPYLKAILRAGGAHEVFEQYESAPAAEASYAAERALLPGRSLDPAAGL